MIKSGTRQKASTMQNTQCNDSTSATQANPEWIHLTINRSSSAPPPVVKQERHSCTPENDVQRVARHATPISPDYSGSPGRKVAHPSMNWTDCIDHGCQIHLGEKQGSGWYPQFTRRSRKSIVAHNHDWRLEMEANPGQDWATLQPLPEEETEGLIRKSRAGSLVVTTIAMKTDGKRWTPAIIPDKWEKKGHCRKMTEGNTRRDEL